MVTSIISKIPNLLFLFSLESGFTRTLHFFYFFHFSVFPESSGCSLLCTVLIKEWFLNPMLPSLAAVRSFSPWGYVCIPAHYVYLYMGVRSEPQIFPLFAPHLLLRHFLTELGTCQCG